MSEYDLKNSLLRRYRSCIDETQRTHSTDPDISRDLRELQRMILSDPHRARILLRSVEDRVFPKAAPGPPGERGEHGMRGEKGDRGARGPRGPEGLRGLQPFYWLGTWFEKGLTREFDLTIANKQLSIGLGLRAEPRILRVNLEEPSQNRETVELVSYGRLTLEPGEVYQAVGFETGQSTETLTFHSTIAPLVGKIVVVPTDPE
jgi:hypothetical protein